MRRPTGWLAQHDRRRYPGTWAVAGLAWTAEPQPGSHSSSGSPGSAPGFPRGDQSPQRLARSQAAHQRAAPRPVCHIGVARGVIFVVVSIGYLIGEPGQLLHGVGPRMIASITVKTWLDRPAATCLIVPVVGQPGVVASAGEGRPATHRRGVHQAGQPDRRPIALCVPDRRARRLIGPAIPARPARRFARPARLTRHRHAPARRR